MASGGLYWKSGLALDGEPRSLATRVKRGLSKHSTCCSICALRTSTSRRRFNCTANVGAPGTPGPPGPPGPPGTPVAASEPRRSLVPSALNESSVGITNSLHNRLEASDLEPSWTQ